MRSKEEIQKLIIFYLTDNDMTVEEMSKIIGAAKPSIYRWINGTNQITNKYYLKLVKLFDGYIPPKEYNLFE